jgi:hypothetical protein
MQSVDTTIERAHENLRYFVENILAGSLPLHKGQVLIVETDLPLSELDKKLSKLRRKLQRGQRAHSAILTRLSEFCRHSVCTDLPLGFPLTVSPDQAYVHYYYTSVPRRCSYSIDGEQLQWLDLSSWVGALEPDPEFVHRLSTTCMECGAHESLKACAGCNIVRYCSRACQKADWGSHKENCSLLKEVGAVLFAMV